MAFSSKTLGVQTLVAAAFMATPLCSISAGDGQYFDRMDKITSGAGNAVAHNIAVQTINPWPRYVHNDHISIDGRRIGIGFTKYQKNRSNPPRGLSTTAGFGTGGGSVDNSVNNSDNSVNNQTGDNNVKSNNNN